MYPNPTNTTATPISSKWEELTLMPRPDLARLKEMGVKLDLLLLALKTLANIRNDALGRVAAGLQLDSVLGNKLIFISEVCGEIEKTKGVSLYSSFPEEQQKAQQIDEARSLVLIISHLARQHQPLIRRAVALIEQTASQNSETALLKDYIENLNRVYREYRLTGEVSDDTPVLLTEKFAFKLLIDLLFYSDSGGHRRLWFGLLNE